MTGFLRTFLAIAFLGLPTMLLHAQLNGTYTINSLQPASSTNYQTVNSAISDMASGTRADGGAINGPGVSGPVTLRIAAGSGPYNEQVSIPAIPGASATKTIRLTGGSGRETIQTATTTTTDRHVVRLSGAKHVILDSLTLINTNTVYGYGVWITANADSNSILNSRIMVDSTLTTSSFVGVTASGATPTTNGDNGDYNVIQGNVISGGYYGITLRGTSTTAYSQQNNIINNEIRGFYYYGIQHYMQNGGVIRGNTIHARSTATSAAYGMYIYYNKDFTIEQNRIYDVGTYGIYLAYTNYLATVIGGRGTVRNNMIGGTHVSTGTIYGIYLTTNGYNNDIWHNSVSITVGNGRCIYILSGSGNDVRNNSFSITGSASGYAAYVSAVTYLSSMNHNNYYAPGSANFVYVGAAYTPLTYQGGGGFNLNSRDGDPYYVNNQSNLHAYSTQLFDGGDPTVPVTVDYDGQVRPHPTSTVPDIGADEFLPDTLNAGVQALLTPVDYLCPDSMQEVSVILRNLGINEISGFQVVANITGAGSAVLSATYMDTLQANESDTLLLGTFNTWPGGTFQFEIVSQMVGDQDQTNDTLRVDVYIGLTVAAPAAISDTICQGDSAVLVASSAGTNFWYDSATGGVLLGLGDTLVTAPLFSNASYFVTSRLLQVGSQSTTYLNNNSCGGGNMFDIAAYSEITIDSFATNLSGPGVVSTVDIYYKVGSHAGFETNAAAWTLLGTASVTSAGPGNPTMVPIGGLTIPAGQTYSLYLYNPNVLYTTLGATTTYANGDMGISCGVGLCSLFGGTNNPRGWNGTVFYRSYGCESARTEVPVKVDSLPVVVLNDSTACGTLILDAGNPGGSYTWSTGDSTQTIEALISGVYGVTVTQDGCSSQDSATIGLMPLPSVNLGPDTAICANQTIPLDAGNPGFLFNWSTGDTTQGVIVPGGITYWVGVTDTNGCMASDSIAIGLSPDPTANFNFTVGAAGLQYDFADLSTGNPSSWSWDFGDGATSTSINPSHTYASSGSYLVTLIVTNSCGSDTLTQSLTVVNVDHGMSWISAQIFPNPTQGSSKLVFSLSTDELVELSVSDMHGRLILFESIQMQAGENRMDIDLSMQVAGVYFVKLSGESGMQVLKLILE